MKVLAVVCSVLISVCNAVSSLAQAPATPTGKLEVLISRYEGEKHVDDQAFTFRLAYGQQGTLASMVLVSDALANGQSCLGSRVPSGQRVGKQIDATVSPFDGKFKVHLVITDRSFAGCRLVGTVEIPVFSNRVTSYDLVLSDGGSEEILFETSRESNTSVKMRTTLAIVSK